MNRIQFWTISFELMTSYVVVDLVLYCYQPTTIVHGLIFHWLAMIDEFEPEMSAHENVVRSSSQPDHTRLHAHLCFNQSTNFIPPSKCIINEVCVGDNHHLPMVTKALRSVF